MVPIKFRNNLKKYRKSIYTYFGLYSIVVNNVKKGQET